MLSLLCSRVARETYCLELMTRCKSKEASFIDDDDKH